MSIKKSIVQISKCQVCFERPATMKCIDCGEHTSFCYQCDEEQHQIHPSHKRELIHHSAAIEKSQSHKNLPRQIATSNIKSNKIISEYKVYFKESANPSAKESPTKRLYDQQQLQNSHSSSNKQEQLYQDADEAAHTAIASPQGNILKQSLPTGPDHSQAMGVPHQEAPKRGELQAEQQEKNLSKYQKIIESMEKSYDDNLRKLHQRLLESEKTLCAERANRQLEIKSCCKPLEDRIRDLQIQNEGLQQKTRLLEERYQQLVESSSQKSRDLQHLIEEQRVQIDMYKNLSKEKDFSVEQNIEFFKDSLITEFEKKEYVINQYQLKQVKQLTAELEQHKLKAYELERELSRTRDLCQDSQETISRLKQRTAEEKGALESKLLELTKELEKERNIVQKIQIENDELVQQNTQYKDENKFYLTQHEIHLKKTEKYELMLFGCKRSSLEGKLQLRAKPQPQPNNITSRYVRLRYQ